MNKFIIKLNFEIQKRKDLFLEKKKAYIWRYKKERINFWRKGKHTFGEKEKKGSIFGGKESIHLERKKRKKYSY